MLSNIFQKETMLAKYKEKLKLPQGHIPLYTIAVGYPEEDSTVHPRKENTVNYIK